MGTGEVGFFDRISECISFIVIETHICIRILRDNKHSIIVVQIQRFAVILFVQSLKTTNLMVKSDVDNAAVAVSIVNLL